MLGNILQKTYIGTRTTLIKKMNVLLDAINIQNILRYKENVKIILGTVWQVSNKLFILTHI